MKNKAFTIAIALFIIFFSIDSVAVRDTVAKRASFTIPSLTPSWTDGLIDGNVGQSGFVVADLDQDGKVDLVSCSNGYAFILNYALDSTYNTIWYSEYIKCLSITSADRDSNGASELYIATEDGQVMLVDGSTHALLDSFSLPEGAYPVDIAIGDVDEDTQPEIVLVTGEATLIYDANNFTLEWNAIGLGGSQLAIGNIDTDPLIEVVVNGNPGRVLNAKQKTQKWDYAGGFGLQMDIGDVDGDGKAEIAYFDNMNDAFVLEGDARTIKWHLTNIGYTKGIAVADTGEDGTSEVIIATAPFGGITGYRGSDGGSLWSIPSPEFGIYGIGVGDTDNDLVNEVVWGTEMVDALKIGSWVTQSLEWVSDDLDQPLYAAANDIDLDGQGEIVMASKSTNDAYDVGKIRIYNGLNHHVEWSIPISDTLYFITQLDIGQLDTDPALEIITGGVYKYHTRIRSFDGISHSAEWTSPMIGDNHPQAMTLMDLDNDSVDEIIVGLPSSEVQVYHGASDLLQWESGPLEGTILDLAAGDVDSDGIKDVAVLTDQSLYLFDSATWTQRLHRSLSGGELVAIKEADAVSGGSLILVSYDGIHPRLLQAWAGPEFLSIWQIRPGNLYLKELALADVDLDGIRELILMGSEGEDGSKDSVLWIGSNTFPQFWEYKNTGAWSTINSMALYDLDSDGLVEFLFSSDDLVQVDEITISSIDIHQAMLPLVRKACIPIFSDDFSNPASGWPNKDTGNLVFAYDNNAYRILIRPTYYIAGARPGVQASDYSVSVDLYNQNGVKGSYGLVFGLAQDWTTFYTLEIYPDGWYGIYRYDPNSMSMLAEGFSAHINQGTASNTIKVVRSDDQIYAYANGNLLANVSDWLYTGTRYIGLISFTYDQPNLDVRFDNFVVNPLICVGQNSSSTDLGINQPPPGYNSLDLGFHAKSYHANP